MAKEDWNEDGTIPFPSPLFLDPILRKCAIFVEKNDDLIRNVNGLKPRLDSMIFLVDIGKNDTLMEIEELYSVLRGPTRLESVGSWSLEEEDQPAENIWVRRSDFKGALKLYNLKYFKHNFLKTAELRLYSVYPSTSRPNTARWLRRCDALHRPEHRQRLGGQVRGWHDHSS